MHWYARYRFLIFIVLLSLVAGVWEYTDPDPDKNAEPPSYPYVMLELYPDSTRNLYTRGMQSYLNRDFPAARNWFEKALEPGIKTDENLLYYYAVVLVHLNANGDEIDAAIAQWRRNFPHSSRPDPRTVVGGEPGIAGPDRPSPKVGDPR